MDPVTQADAPTIGIERRDIATKGARVRIAYAGDGPPVVLLHDVLQSHLAWNDVLPALAARMRVVAIDLPGAGESEKPATSRFSYAFAAFADAVADVIAALDLGRVALVGHGLGAAVALSCAANHPAIATKLVLVAPTVYGDGQSPLDRLAKVPLFGPMAIKQLVGFSEFRRYFREYVYAEGARVPAARVREHFDRFSAPASREATFATVRGTSDRRPVIALVPRVRQETLVVAGRLDRLVPNSHGRRLVRELGSARLIALDAGHSPPEEAPEAFAAAVLDFLEPPRGKAR
jgi:pimeloyl-ACP methyl ester carboxylesterase